MKAHHLGVLIAAAVLAVVAGMWTSNVHEPEAVGDAGTPLLPGLAEAVNEVTAVKLVGPGNEAIATLTRGEQTWHLAEKYGHRANVAKVRELLLKLSRAKLLEEKTSNPEFYDRLGVESVDQEDSAGVLIEFEGVDVPSVIIGNPESAREAVYARRADEATSWLASGSIFIAKDISDWLGREVLDISASRIAEVEITHPDGEVVLVSKAAFGQPNYNVANIPAGRELERASIANAMASVIEGLNIDDVLPAEGSGFDELSTTRATWRAFDGYVVQAEVAAKDDKYYARFSAGTDAATAAKYLPASNEPTADGSDDEQPAGGTGEQGVSGSGADAIDPGPMPDTSPRPEPDLSVVAEEAEEQNKAFTGWIYAIPKYKYDQMTRRMEDLLKDPTK